MAQMTAEKTNPPPRRDDWYARPPEEVLVAFECDPQSGLTAAQVSDHAAKYGPNTLKQEKPPSVWSVAVQQVIDPMNIMLIAVAIVSMFIQEWGTAILVWLLVVFNVVMGAQQELKARASVEALAKMQVPTARVTRDGALQQVPAPELVPGDLVNVESGDIVPADGRILQSATLETQEAALTGESVPIAKDSASIQGTDVPLGDRIDMLYQNTSVTRGSGQFVVTATGMNTEVGRIAAMLTSVERTRSPLQLQLADLTKKIAWIAWGAVVIIVVAGKLRGLTFQELLLLGIAMAISAIPTGMPTFVQAMLAYGANQLAEAAAIVRNLTDVETLGATSAINTDKTGTLTLNQMTARQLFYQGEWFEVKGEGYAKSGEILGVAGAGTPDFAPLAYISALASDATVSDDGSVVGDPTEAAVVVLAAKVGVSAEESRRAYPRLAQVPFDSAYKFMATFHRLPLKEGEQVVGLVKGGPDVILARCATAQWAGGDVAPIDKVRGEIDAANDRLAGSGLRVLALAGRPMGDFPSEMLAADPMAQVQDLRFYGLVGIIDPLRPEAKSAVETARAAGIDVRMITGDHVVTAQAIARELGLGPGGMTGAEFAAKTDQEVKDALPNLHVFGRVAPEDKLRLVQIMQSTGMIIAMTGDAVNDAAALKQADIGVAMGSGSEVSKQAAKMVLTDDNFTTLVHAVSLGRTIYSKISTYVNYQMSQLVGLVSLFLLATIFNINMGVALLPIQVLFLNFFVSIAPVIAIISAPEPAGIMQEKPRDPKARIASSTNVIRWAVFGLLLALGGVVAIFVAPGQPATTGPSVPITMGFVTIGLGTAWSSMVFRPGMATIFERPFFRPMILTFVAAAIVLLATELQFFQRLLDTTSLSNGQWLTCLALSLPFAIAVEIDKRIRLRRARREVSP
jgi:P-type Ca2+ transporter type 2C